MQSAYRVLLLCNSSLPFALCNLRTPACQILLLKYIFIFSDEIYFGLSVYLLDFLRNILFWINFLMNHCGGQEPGIQGAMACLDRAELAIIEE